MYTQQMVIENFEVFATSLPMTKPVAMASVTISRAENVFVRLSGSGVTGWGEATDARTTTGESASDIAAALVNLRSRLPLPTSVSGAGDLVRSLLRDAPAARSAAEMALLDLEARQRGVPAWKLLGDDALVAQPAVHIVSGRCVEEEVDDARQAYAAGVRFFKLKAGRRLLEEEFTGIAAVTAALGPDAVCGADANEGLSLEAALEYAVRGQALGLTYLEQPVPRATLRDLVERARAQGSRMPVAADESVGTASDVCRLDGLVDGVVLKLQKAGGPADLVAAALAARRLGMMLGLTGKVAESSVAGAALLHASAACGSPNWGVSLTLTSLAVDPVHSSLERRNGWWQPPTGPGLGIEPDEDVLRKFAVDQ